MAESSSPAPTPVAAFLLRIYWMLFAYIAVVLAAIIIINKHLQSAIMPNVIYFLIPASAILARYIDIRCYHGKAADGEQPATMKHLANYSIQFTTVCVAAWIGIQLIARLGLF